MPEQLPVLVESLAVVAEQFPAVTQHVLVGQDAWIELPGVAPDCSTDGRLDTGIAVTSRPASGLKPLLSINLRQAPAVAADLRYAAGHHGNKAVVDTRE